MRRTTRSGRPPPHRSPTPAWPRARATPTASKRWMRRTTSAAESDLGSDHGVLHRLRGSQPEPGTPASPTTLPRPTRPSSPPVRSPTSSTSATGCSSPARSRRSGTTRHQHHDATTSPPWRRSTSTPAWSTRPSGPRSAAAASPRSRPRPTAPSSSSSAASTPSTASPSARSPRINPTTGATVHRLHREREPAATSVEATNTTVYIGGQFTTINGDPARRLAAVNATTGARS